MPRCVAGPGEATVRTRDRAFTVLFSESERGDGHQRPAAANAREFGR